MNKRKKEKNPTCKTAAPAARSQLEQPIPMIGPMKSSWTTANNKISHNLFVHFCSSTHEAEEKVAPDAKLPKKENRAALGDDGVRPLSFESRFEEAALAVDKPGGTTPIDPSFKQGAQ